MFVPMWILIVLAVLTLPLWLDAVFVALLAVLGGVGWVLARVFRVAALPFRMLAKIAAKIPGPAPLTRPRTWYAQMFLDFFQVLGGPAWLIAVGLAWFGLTDGQPWVVFAAMPVVLGYPVALRFIRSPPQTTEASASPTQGPLA